MVGTRWRLKEELFKNPRNSVNGPIYHNGKVYMRLPTELQVTKEGDGRCYFSPWRWMSNEELMSLYVRDEPISQENHPMIGTCWKLKDEVLKKAMPVDKWYASFYHSEELYVLPLKMKVLNQSYKHGTYHISVTEGDTEYYMFISTWKFDAFYERDRQANVQDLELKGKSAVTEPVKELSFLDWLYQDQLAALRGRKPRVNVIFTLPPAPYHVFRNGRVELAVPGPAFGPGDNVADSKGGLNHGRVEP